MASAEEKGKAADEKRKRYFAFLDNRIPELHEQGVLGRKARDQADREWGALDHAST